MLEEIFKVNISMGNFTGNVYGYNSEIVVECFSNIVFVSTSGINMKCLKNVFQCNDEYIMTINKL